jgi:hypothetical protein
VEAPSLDDDFPLSALSEVDELFALFSDSMACFRDDDG